MEISHLVFDRKIAMMEWHNWLLRLCLSVITYYMLRSGFDSASCERAVYNCGLLYPYIRDPLTAIALKKKGKKTQKIYMLTYLQSLLR